MPDTPDRPDGAHLPTKEYLQALPRWARVAFAARCARRVQPLFAHFRQKAPKEHIEAVDTAITLTERSAADARAVAPTARASCRGGAEIGKRIAPTRLSVRRHPADVVL
ncbi:hypothetical protein FBT69_05385 [Synechococcales cyanobacterium CNB]|nr:hypothetical protein [Phycisphaerales bacterium]MDL1904235.1 hypothetical protein [Synechococcales cyanobacterium CNB]